MAGLLAPGWSGELGDVAAGALATDVSRVVGLPPCAPATTGVLLEDPIRRLNKRRNPFEALLLLWLASIGLIGTGLFMGTLLLPPSTRSDSSGCCPIHLRRQTLNRQDSASLSCVSRAGQGTGIKRPSFCWWRLVWNRSVALSMTDPQC